MQNVWQWRVRLGDHPAPGGRGACGISICPSQLHSTLSPLWRPHGKHLTALLPELVQPGRLPCAHALLRAPTRRRHLVLGFTLLLLRLRLLGSEASGHHGSQAPGMRQTKRA